jgi:hypothetical protein
VEYEAGFGEMHSEALGSYDEDAPVTNDNRAEFVELYVKNLLEDRIRGQYEAFAKAGAVVELITWRSSSSSALLQFSCLYTSYTAATRLLVLPRSLSLSPSLSPSLSLSLSRSLCLSLSLC